MIYLSLSSCAVAPSVLRHSERMPNCFHFSTRSEFFLVNLAVSVQSVVRHPLSMVPQCSGLESITSQPYVNGSLVGTRCRGSVLTSFRFCCFCQHTHSSAKLLHLFFGVVTSLQYHFFFLLSIVLEPLSIRKFKVCLPPSFVPDSHRSI